MSWARWRCATASGCCRSAGPSGARWRRCCCSRRTGPCRPGVSWTECGASSRPPPRPARSRTRSRGCVPPWATESRAGPAGYLLRVEPGELDLDRFRTLVAEASGADAPAAAELLRQALALWRGPALADLEGEPAHAGAAHLDELRLDHAGAAHRRRPRARPPHRARVRAGGAHRRASLPRAPLGPAPACPLPVRPPGRRPGRLRPRPPRARRPARRRAGPGAARAARASAPPGPGARRARDAVRRPSGRRLVRARRGATVTVLAGTFARRRGVATPRRAARRCGGSSGEAARTIERHGGTPASAAVGRALPRRLRRSRERTRTTRSVPSAPPSSCGPRARSSPSGLRPARSSPARPAPATRSSPVRRSTRRPASDERRRRRRRLRAHVAARPARGHGRIGRRRVPDRATSIRLRRCSSGGSTRRSSAGTTSSPTSCASSSAPGATPGRGWSRSSASPESARPASRPRPVSGSGRTRRVLVGRCTEHGGDATYAPLREVVDGRGRRHDRRTADALMDGEPNGELVAARVADALGAGSAPRPRGRDGVGDTPSAGAAGARPAGRARPRGRPLGAAGPARRRRARRRRGPRTHPRRLPRARRAPRHPARLARRDGQQQLARARLVVRGRGDPAARRARRRRASRPRRRERGSSASPTAIRCTSSSSSPRPATRPPTACRTRSRLSSPHGWTHSPGTSARRSTRPRSAGARSPLPPSPSSSGARCAGRWTSSCAATSFARRTCRSSGRRRSRSAMRSSTTPRTQRSQAPPGRPPPGSRRAAGARRGRARARARRARRLPPGARGSARGPTSAKAVPSFEVSAGRRPAVSTGRECGRGSATSAARCGRC